MAAGTAKVSGTMPVATRPAPIAGPVRIPIASTVLDATLAPTSSFGERASEGSSDACAGRCRTASSASRVASR